MFAQYRFALDLFALDLFILNIDISIGLHWICLFQTLISVLELFGCSIMENQ